MKRSKSILNAFFICNTIFFSIILNPRAASVSNSWDEDFDDNNYEGWNVLDGNFSASNNILVATGGKNDHHRIKYPSTISYGQWSFDVFVNTSSYLSGEHMYLYFLMEELGSLGEEKGYYLALWVDPPASILFGKRIGAPFTILGVYEYSKIFTNYQHIDITRNIEGHFNIFVNSSLIIEGLDNEITTSNQFGFDTPGGHGLDNISVSNEIMIWPENEDQANLKFSSNSETVSIQQGGTQSISISILNEGKATGYGSLVFGSVPNGISINVIGPDSVKDVRKGDTKQFTLSIKADTGVSPDVYEVDINLHNSSKTIDTLKLEITISSSGAPSGFLIINFFLLLGIAMIIRRRHK
jgi:hypothetical protein